MADVLIFLTSITLILLASIVAIAIARRTKLPLPLLLFSAGIILGNIFYLDRPLVQLTGTFLSAFSIVALLIVIFDATSKLKFYDIDTTMKHGVWFFVIALVLNVVVMSSISHFFFGLQWFAAVILSLLISCVEYTAIFPPQHVPHNKITQLLKDESSVSCAFILLIPFLIIVWLQMETMGPLFGKIIAFATVLFADIGAGVIIALILFKLLNSRALEKFSSFIIGAAVLLAYVVAQHLGGNGIVSVATIGFIFGNVFLKHKSIIRSQENNLYRLLEVLMFIIVGVVVSMPISFDFFRLSFGLFVVYLVIRVLAAVITLKEYDFVEKLEVALFVPKGLTTVTLAFALLNYSFFGVVLLVQLLLSFFLYSMVFDTVLDRFGVYKSR
jgi:NhaP-type Na+/H+ and K+/H+ antiporter